MKAVNEMKLTIESRSVNESFARVAVSAFVAGLDPTVDEISDIKTAVSEAVTNCIVHAYENTMGRIYIWVGETPIASPITILFVLRVSWLPI